MSRFRIKRLTGIKSNLFTKWDIWVFGTSGTSGTSGTFKTFRRQFWCAQDSVKKVYTSYGSAEEFVIATLLLEDITLKQVVHTLYMNVYFYIRNRVLYYLQYLFTLHVFLKCF